MSEGERATWNYRVMRHKHKGEVGYAIHEVFYKEDGYVAGWSADAVDPYGDTVVELAEVLQMMMRATTEPVLDLKTGKEVE